MAPLEKKTLARSFGQFLGHIVKAVRSDPKKDTHEVSRTVEEQEQEGMTLRRTTIDEIELRKND